jgi:hypothetical protein
MLVLGLMFFTLAAVDLAGWLVGLSLTGSAGSAPVLILLGVLFFMLAAPAADGHES